MPKRERILVFSLIFIILLLQYPLWFGDASVLNMLRLRHEIGQQKAENARLAERNQALEAEVRDLKHGLAAIEEKARSDLGMIKKDEVFVQVVEPDKEDAGSND